MRNFMYTIFILSLFTGCKDDTGGPTPPGDGPILSTINYDVTESDQDKTLKVNIGFADPLTRSSVLNYELIEQTATAGLDFETQSGQLVYAIGETQKELNLSIVGDFIPEETETFQIRLFSSANSFEEKLTTITIIDNDKSIEDLVIPGGTSSPESYPGYNLVWADEFKDNALSSEFWNIETGNGCPDLCGWGNNELEYYTPDNIYFRDDDYLVIQARPENIGFNEYTSSRITTEGKKSFQYGRIDIRAVLPEGPGIWPALWMLGDNIRTVSWPACGEMDIMELIGSAPRTVHGTFHYGPNFNDRQQKGSSYSLDPGQKFIDEFHVFSLVWEEDRVQVLMDDILVQEMTPDLIEPYAYPFNESFFFIFNVAVGGNWPGSPNLNTTFPQHMIVDYIRVFQK